MGWDLQELLQDAFAIKGDKQFGMPYFLLSARFCAPSLLCPFISDTTSYFPVSVQLLILFFPLSFTFLEGASKIQHVKADTRLP